MLSFFKTASEAKFGISNASGSLIRGEDLGNIDNEANQRALWALLSKNQGEEI